MIEADIRVTRLDGSWTIYIDNTFSDPFPNCQQAIECALVLAEMLGDSGQDASVLIEDMEDLGDVLITLGALPPEIEPKRPTIH